MAAELEADRLGVVCGARGFRQPCVLLRDYNGWWAPLSELYFSSSSSCLVSRHPQSCVEETVSYYCPRCLNRYLNDEAKRQRLTCTRCFQCPRCSSMMAFVYEPAQAQARQEQEQQEKKEGGDAAAAVATQSVGLACGYCQWRSVSAGIVAPDDKELSALVLRLQAEDAREVAFQNLMVQMEGGLIQSPSDEMMTMLTEATSAAAGGGGGASASASSEAIEAAASPQPPLRPICLPLRSKRAKRCRKDVEAMAPSIMIQPKALPLEGDSSLRVHRGRWWQKDSCAVHFVPRMSIHRLPSKRQLANASRPMRVVVDVLNPYRDDKVYVALLAGWPAAEQERDAHPAIGRACTARWWTPILPPAAEVAEASTGGDGGAVPYEIEVEPSEDELLRDQQDDASIWRSLVDPNTARKAWTPSSETSAAGVGSEGDVDMTVFAGCVENCARISFALGAPATASDEEANDGDVTAAPVAADAGGPVAAPPPPPPEPRGETATTATTAAVKVTLLFSRASSLAGGADGSEGAAAAAEGEEAKSQRTNASALRLALPLVLAWPVDASASKASSVHVSPALF